MNRLTIAPRVDFGAIAPLAMAMPDNGEGMAGGNVSYSSTTTINTNQDPMRVLRASRHLDKLVTT
jgi:hypothetical protein